MKILLRYFSDRTTAITLLLVMLATNIIQYVAIDSAQSHGWIFPLYVFILYFTIKWHEKPKLVFACVIGYIIGLSAICRPTEAIMLFIPLFWGTQTKESAKEKWALVKQHKKHIWYALFFCFLGVLPQLIYWQIATGFFVYDVGSKWQFLNPFFSVLFGFESGWFIYTPVTIFFIVGMFFMSKRTLLGKPYPFNKAVLWYCLLTIYVIISWFDGNPDSTYSCRRFSEMLPVFSLPMAAYIQYLHAKKWRFVFYILGLYFIGVNIFQLWQYNKSILHDTDMNMAYYSHIYLNPHPTPLDMSLLDTNDYLSNESIYKMDIIAHIDTAMHLQANPNSPLLLYSLTLTDSINKSITDEWLKIEAEIKTTKGYWNTYLRSEIQEGNVIKQNKVRLFSPISWDGGNNKYAFYVKVPNCSVKNILRLKIFSKNEFEGVMNSLKVSLLKKGN